ncbi:unnamed protein product [Schistosoma margrebowiei]|uniref:long-chain-fatty-acid--CoA ligase n=1 Tax=Schistosoma margrebowiei TaxID=48269 RepID=A0A3P8I7Y1_9TREM|nr:unnamed protein product [Schistosoma margrebowiei]
MKLFKSNAPENLISVHLNQQSVICDPKVDKKIKAIGSALVKTVRQRRNAENFVGIYGPNSPEWVIMQHACAAYGYTIVPIYPTFGNEAIQHILSQTQVNCMLCNSGTEALHLLDKFESSLEYLIIVSYDVKVEEVKSRHGSKVSVYLFEDFMELGMNKLLPKKVSFHIFLTYSLQMCVTVPPIINYSRKLDAPAVFGTCTVFCGFC